MDYPLRGEIWLIRLDPVKGAEIKKTRPCLVLSNDVHNRVSRVVTVIPVTSHPIRYPSVQISVGEESGLIKLSCLELPQIRVADKTRLVRKVGFLAAQKLREIFLKLNMHLGFSEFLLACKL